MLRAVPDPQTPLPCSCLARPASAPPPRPQLRAPSVKLSLTLCKADPMLALLTTTSLVGDIYLPTGWRCFPVGDPWPGVFPKSHQAGAARGPGTSGGSLGRGKAGGRATRRGQLQDTRPSAGPGMPNRRWGLLLQVWGTGRHEHTRGLSMFLEGARGPRQEREGRADLLLSPSPGLPSSSLMEATGGGVS